MATLVPMTDAELLLPVKPAAFADFCTSIALASDALTLSVAKSTDSGREHDRQSLQNGPEIPRRDHTSRDYVYAARLTE